ncbi:hypothetical protein BOA8489_03138 [Boseongicola aestuarii]|uniref:Uncharacterized protein n=1 Tax=Boseongicola aestuarii TaxID=1470561 RepID=A0A238J4B9_9RHOB|nr:hypothetical protein BOA8489_03138 [Boseongicola aestuarii]
MNVLGLKPGGVEALNFEPKCVGGMLGDDLEHAIA